MTLFRAYDIRGVYGKELRDEDARRLGSSAARLRPGTWCVGRDGRWSSPRLMAEFIEGLLEAGASVVNLGMAANPLVYHYSWSRRVYGAYITASHNPPEYNGVKLIRPDGTSFVQEYEELRRIFRENLPVSFGGGVVEEDPAPSYIETISRLVGDLRGVEMVAETFGGATTPLLPLLEKRFGVKFRLLTPRVLGDFGGRRPEPGPRTLLHLRREKGAGALGVGFDGDGDRSVFVDEKGRVLTGSMAGSVLARLMVRKGDRVVLTPDTSSGLARLVEDLGGTVVWSRVGHGFIEERVRDSGAVLGIEESSHFYFGVLYPFSDGPLASLLVARARRELGEIASLVDEAGIQPTAKIYVKAPSDRAKYRAVEILREKFPDAQGFEDGFKIWLEDGWVLIRVSNTMPEVNIAAEAPDQKSLEKRVSEYRSLVEKVLSTLGSQEPAEPREN